MKQSVNMPVYRGWLQEYGSLQDLQAACYGQGLQGIEPIWGDEAYAGPLPAGVAVGYQLSLYTSPSPRDLP